jgi:hypothetical protein
MTTTGKGFHYPVYTDTPDVPRDLERLAEDVDAYLDAHPGPTGATGPAATVAIGTITTVASTVPAAVTNAGTSTNAIFNFTIPRGVDGVIGGPGPANSLSVNPTITGAAGTQASVVISGTAPSQTLTFTIPKGDTGATGAQGATGATGATGPAAATISVGSTATGNAGTNASVTNSGTSSAVVLNFTIPRGAAGAVGPAGADGAVGPAGADGVTPTLYPLTTPISLNIPNGPADGVDSHWYPLGSGVSSLGVTTASGGATKYWKDAYFTGTVRAASVIATGNMFINTSTIVSSDRNAKNTITESNLGLSFINSLNPVSYKYNIGGILSVPNEDGTHTETAVAGTRTHYGLIAQEVKEALDEAGIEDFGGWVNQEDNTQALRYEEFIAPLIKAVQELSARIQAIEEA